MNDAKTESTEEIVIDLNEEKKDELKETKPQTSSPEIVSAKRIDELTDAEKKILIDNARAGIENQYYDVKLYKNGTTRICKRKKLTLCQQAVNSNGERSLNRGGDTHKVYMTDNQLIWEHVLELENKYNNLYRKHKKLKAKYNDLYIEDDVTPYSQQQRTVYDEETVKSQPQTQQQRTIYEEETVKSQPDLRSCSAQMTQHERNPLGLRISSEPREQQYEQQAVTSPQYAQQYRNVNSRMSWRDMLAKH